MTGNRRELPRSKVAGHRVGPHRAVEGSPCGRDHPLPQPSWAGSWSGVAQGLVSGDGPDEAGELARAGDDDLLVGLAAAGHPPPATVEALLGAPRALEDLGVLAALAARELIAAARRAPRVPGRFDEQPADVAGA